MAWKTSYHHYDAQGSTRQLTDETETVTDTYNYDAFGNELSHTGTTRNPFRWNGRWGYHQDADTGTYQVRQRAYEPVIARWFSVDPTGFESQDINLYRLSQNNAVNLIDFDGLRCRVCASGKMYRVNIANLDIHMVNKVFTQTMANQYDFLKRGAFGNRGRSVGATIPANVTVTGPKEWVNDPIRFPPPRVYALAYFPFFVDFNVCESEVGHCQVDLWETWKVERWQNAVQGWQDVTNTFDPNKGVRHRGPEWPATPPRLPNPIATFGIAKRRNSTGGCEDKIIFTDIPAIGSILKRAGRLVTRIMKFTIKQEIIVRDTSGTDPDYSVLHTFTIGHDEAGTLFAQP